LVFTHPIPDKTLVLSRYSKEYFQNEYLPYIKNEYPAVIHLYNMILDLIKNNLNIKNKKMLEVGCGTGLFLSIAKENGFVVEGIEYNSSMVEYGKKEYGIEIQQFDIDKKGKLSDEKCGVIVLMDFIEHIVDPYSTLMKCHECLEQDGIIFISTPNIECKFVKELGAEWKYVSPAEHLYYFSKDTLSKLLYKIGFKILSIHFPNEDTKDVMFFLAKNSQTN
jgi:2-polyprenyl-3-methyl-5-hydroxy-6-metoxy-1,4-benzoquinol methylase